MGAFRHLFYTVLRGYLDIFKSKGISLWNFAPNSEPGKILLQHVDGRNVLLALLDKVDAQSVICFSYSQGNGKMCNTCEECWWRAHLPVLGREPVGG